MNKPEHDQPGDYGADKSTNKDSADLTGMSPAQAWMGDTPPGVYRVVGRMQPKHLLATVAAQGWRPLYIDGNMVDDKSTFLAAAGTAFAFPDYAGHNWDAFEELIRDLEWLPAPGYVLLYDHAHHFARAQPHQWQTALSIFQHAIVSWQAVDIPFYVLLRRTWWTNRSLPVLTLP